ncbi:WD40/YVTN/BNR-like repeat-containing protein [Methylibium petroleiphilum]|uniref:WD40/YVTN/BNR-like repeat-containing protein n=1 Tax=Methylibium petroleiphilum TaxID=105560 RepID=UPI001AD389FD|nr:YCF48-related protein [Methylibium petroleiphilum]MBN9206973.1 photosystem II stability/assembly factor-like protein [Methylibium petroleiphilum]
MPARHQHERCAARGGRLRPAALLARFAAAALLCGGPAATVAQTAAAAAAAPAAAGVKQIRHGTHHDALYDVVFEGERGIAVGAFGSVLVTADGGATWQVQPFPMKHLALMSVAMHEGRCIAVGQTGLVYAAEDCKTWKAAPSMTKSRLLAVGVNRHGVAYAVGAFGTILKSADWGRSWAVQTVDWSGITEDGAEPHLYDVHVAEDGVVTAVGEFELVMRTTDGAQWKALHKGERSLFGLSVVDGGTMYAVGQSGALLRSADGGTTWASLKSGTQAILTGVHATARGEVLASGINSVVVSRDGGASWAPVTSKLVRNAWYQALAASEGAGGQRRLVAVGAGGSILELDL